MEIFCYNAAKPREELESFNHRLAAFCTENMVIGHKAEMLGPSLVVSLTLAEDMDIEAANTLSVRVVLADGLHDSLEDDLTKVLDLLSAENSDEDPMIPFSVDVAVRSDLPVQGFVIIVSTNGVAVDEEHTRDEEG
jgi:hypothetical protein